MTANSALDLPALPAGTAVVLRANVRVVSARGVVRTLLAGDRLEVCGHRPGEPLADCRQVGPTACRVMVPASLLRRVGKTHKGA
jgi:hypothetical protein